MDWSNLEQHGAICCAMKMDVTPSIEDVVSWGYTLRHREGGGPIGTDLCKREWMLHHEGVKSCQEVDVVPSRIELGQG